MILPEIANVEKTIDIEMMRAVRPGGDTLYLVFFLCWLSRKHSSGIINIVLFVLKKRCVVP
jgi:hypothetical protein